MAPTATLPMDNHLIRRKPRCYVEAPSEVEPISGDSVVLCESRNEDIPLRLAIESGPFTVNHSNVKMRERCQEASVLWSKRRKRFRRQVSVQQALQIELK